MGSTLETILILPPEEKPERNPYAGFKKGLDAMFREQVDELRHAIIIEERPDVSFEQIGGQALAVEEARRLANQLQHPEVFHRWGVDVPRGILFYGEPGNGKTLIAKALAHEAKAPFIYVKSADISSKWYGDAEKMAKEVFNIARGEADKHDGHAIIFLDEVDSLIPSRGGMLHEATRRIIGVFLQEIDGLQTQAGITIIASTNTPEAVDAAFLSRMTNWVEVPPPDASGLAEIFNIHFQNASKTAGRNLIENDIDFAVITQPIIGVSGRDIADIVQIVLATKAQEELKGEQVTYVTIEDIRKATGASAKVREAKKRQKRNSGLGFRPQNSN